MDEKNTLLKLEETRRLHGTSKINTEIALDELAKKIADSCHGKEMLKMIIYHLMQRADHRAQVADTQDKGTLNELRDYREGCYKLAEAVEKLLPY